MATERPVVAKTRSDINDSGPHATVYLINGDRYIGDWMNNQRHGKGIHYYKKNGYIYEGEFSNDMRAGYGTLSIPTVAPVSTFKASAPGSLFSGAAPKSVDGEEVPLRKVYTGSWALDKRHGQGTYFYADGSVYNGFWANDMKEGWGVYWSDLANDLCQRERV
jgi:hypothetical protein